MKTTILKLITGEEIIGKFVKETDNTIILEDVRSLMIQPTSDGRFGLAILPWLAGAHSGNISVPTRSIVGRPTSTTPKDIEDEYIKQTSGIAVVSGGDFSK